MKAGHILKLQASQISLTL